MKVWSGTFLWTDGALKTIPLCASEPYGITESLIPLTGVSRGGINPMLLPMPFKIILYFLKHPNTLEAHNLSPTTVQVFPQPIPIHKWFRARTMLGASTWKVKAIESALFVLSESLLRSQENLLSYTQCIQQLPHCKHRFPPLLLWRANNTEPSYSRLGSDVLYMS